MAYNFIRANSQYLAANTSALTFPLTIAGWCKPFNATSPIAMGSVGIFGSQARCQIQVPILGDRFRLAQVDNGGNNVGANCDATFNFVMNQWNHGCGVFRSLSSRTAFCNGVEGTTDTVVIGTTSPFINTYIGTRFSTSFGFYFEGDIAEFGVWNTDLNPAEIASLARGVTCDKIRPQNLVFYTPLIRNVQDTKGGIIITPNNNPTVAIHPRIYK